MAPESKRPYKLSEADRVKYAGIYLLEHIINVPHTFNVLLEGPEQNLERILQHLLSVGHVEIQEIVESKKRTGFLGLKKERLTGQHYVPTEKGREFLEKFMARYSEYLSVYDLYCAVDLEAAEFAFAKRVELWDSPAAWDALLKQERFTDVRVAVAEYKGLDPVEIVFMSFITEGRFALEEDGWQVNLLTGEIFDEILNIVNTSYEWTDIGDEEVIRDILAQGSELMYKLLLDAEEADKQRAAEDEQAAAADDDDDYYVQPVTTPMYPPGYYDPYYRDPFYISPLWVVPLLILL